MKPIETDVLIIGAGPAGSIAAAGLLKAGVKVTIAERDRFPRFVIGESLLPCSMGTLEEAGLLPAVEQQHFMQKNGALFLRGKESCDFDFACQFTPGWKYTYQVTRADFDLTLARTVAERGADIFYGHSVSAVRFEAETAGATLTCAEGTREVTAKFILDCSGYGRVLPRLLNLEAPSSFPSREALFSHVKGDHRPTGRDEGKIWICTHPGGAWMWVIPFSNGLTSVGAVGDPEFFAQYKGSPEERLRAIIMDDENVPTRLRDSEFVFSPRTIAGYACSVKQIQGPRFALAGHATEFLDPIFSSGVSLSLSSGHRAGQLIPRFLRGEAVDWQAEYVDYVMQGLNTFRAYVTAWYDGRLPQIFYSPRRDPTILRQVCSVLAGYVHDKTNPYVARADAALTVLAKVVRQTAGPAVV